MIDTKELRRLAQAATSGEWYVERGNHIYGRNEVTDGEEVWPPLIACTDDDEVNVNFEANASFIAAANPAAISELLDRLEESESDALEQARLNGMGASREAALMAKLEAVEKDVALKERIIDSLGVELNAVAKERDALRAKIEAMEKQEPVAWLHETRSDSDVVTSAVKHVWQRARPMSLASYSIPLYLAPGAKGEEK